MALPVVLVVGVRLGCINHALLSAEAILGDGLALAGWVVEGYGAASGFLVAVGAGWLAWLLALACFRVLAQDEAGDCAVSG